MINPSEERKLRLLSFATHATRGLIRDQRARRKVLLATLLGALGLIIVGTTFLREVLDHREHPVWFVVFWFACAWLTVLTLLLALFDLLIVRAQGRAARKAFRDEFGR